MTEDSMLACTVVAQNYLPMARVLAESFRAHHPRARFAVLVVDDVEEALSARDEPFEVIRPDQIGLSIGEFRQMAMMYDVTELSTAVKPWLLRVLLASNPAGVLFLDPDIWVFAPLDDLTELIRQHSIVLTPHTLSPMARDQLRPGEDEILRAGAYNLGFIGVGPGSEVFLDWWASRLSRHAISDPDSMMFTDQRWVDLVPGYFRTHILRDASCNVAYWNVDRRSFTWTGERYEVDGKPLRFFHFSGYDPDRPSVLSKHTGDKPRVQLSAHPVLARLCAEYASKLRAAGFGSDSPPYGFAKLGSGIPIDSTMRRAYRRAVMDAESSGDLLPPDPFAQQPTTAFVDWLHEPIGRDQRLSRYLYELYLTRLDLRDAFSAVPGRDTKPYLQWVSAFGAAENNIPEDFVPPEDAAPALTPTLPGVNVAGYMRAESGVAEAARQMLTAVRSANLDAAVVVFDRTVTRQSHAFTPDATDPIYDTNLICVNADQLPAFAEEIDDEFFEGRHSIGLWHWEVEEFPLEFHDAFNFVDEVWVASKLVESAVRRVSPKPVFVCPLLASEPAHTTTTRSDLGLPDGFLFLFIFDFLSVFERKNPIGLVRAFRQAFGPGEGPVLVLKAINGQFRVEDDERLRLEVEQHPDVLLLSEYVSSEERDALLSLSDCYVSLHRSEGFGFTMAEAMYSGKPVIATNYGGNLEFMDDSNSFLVPSRLVQIPAGCDPYPTTARWAEPDLSEAARMMRLVFEDPSRAKEIGEKARLDIAAKHNSAVTATFVRDRFDAIHQMRRSMLKSDNTLTQPRGSLMQRVARPVARLALRSVRLGADPPSWLSPYVPFIRRVVRRPYDRLMAFADPKRRSSRLP